MSVIKKILVRFTTNETLYVNSKFEFICYELNNTIGEFNCIVISLTDWIQVISLGHFDGKILTKSSNVIRCDLEGLSSSNFLKKLGC